MSLAGLLLLEKALFGYCPRLSMRSGLIKLSLCKVVNFSLKAKLLTIKREITTLYFILNPISQAAPSPDSYRDRVRLSAFTPRPTRQANQLRGNAAIPSRWSYRFTLALFFAILSCTSFVHAQVEKPKVNQPKIVLKDSLKTNPTIPLKSDTSKVNIDSPDSSIKSDTSKVKQDSLKRAKKGEIETTITYTAKDSINFSLDQKIVRLYGDAVVTYGAIQLDAELIVIDYEKSEITANGKPDSTGRLVGFPIFKDGEGTYETTEMVYNFKTKKAKILGVVTKQGDGFVHGKTVFKNDKNELFTIGNAYTTCDLKDPHFRIISSKAKAIPGEKVITGPFYMEFNHVPTPLGFAFGMFPSPRKSASGIIVPSYGEETRRGFFLQNMGYYFDISDYIKLTVLVDLYSKGSTALKINTVYNNRYKYAGSLNFSYTNTAVNSNIEDLSNSKDFILNWSHSPKTKGTGRFSASVSAATNSFTSNNYLGANAATNPQLTAQTRKLTSNVSYSKSFSGTPLSLGVNLRHSQDIVTKQVDLPLPDITFNVNNLYPLKKYSQLPILENFNIRYSMAGTNQITNNLGKIGRNPANDSIAPFTVGNMPTFFKNAKNGIRHNIPLTTSFKVLKFFTISPNATVDALWYLQTLNWKASAYTPGTAQQAVVSDTSKIFNQVTNYSLSVGLTTRIYGTWLSRNPKSTIRGIRHLITPSISYSYNPDFGDPSYGYYQEVVLKDAKGNDFIIRKSHHEGFVYGSSKTGKSNTMGFGIGNTVEMKVRSKKDTVDKKISIFNSLSINSSYNFAANSFKLAPVSMSANTNVLNSKLTVNINATLDPYLYQVQHTDLQTPVESKTFIEMRLDQYAWETGSLGRITNAGLALSTNLSPKGQKKDIETKDKITKSNATQADKDYLLQNPQAYVDFKIPWNLRFNYNINYSRLTGTQSATPELAVPKSQLTQALNFSGDLSLTTKWKITFNSGYDFVNNAFTQTNLGTSRDLHCWQMSINWVPFGTFQSYNFNIGIKSTLLQDLKLNRTRSFFDSR